MGRLSMRELSETEMASCEPVLKALNLRWQAVTDDDCFLALTVETREPRALVMRRPVVEAHQGNFELVHWQVLTVSRFGQVGTAYVVDNRPLHTESSNPFALHLANEVLIGPAMRISLQALWHLMDTFGVEQVPQFDSVFGSDAALLVRLENILDCPSLSHRELPQKSISNG